MNFENGLSEIGGQTPIEKTISSGMYLGITVGIQKVGDNIPDNLNESSGNEFSGMIEEIKKRDESL